MLLSSAIMCICYSYTSPRVSNARKINFSRFRSTKKMIETTCHLRQPHAALRSTCTHTSHQRRRHHTIPTFAHNPTLLILIHGVRWPGLLGCSDSSSSRRRRRSLRIRNDRAGVPRILIGPIRIRARVRRRESVCGTSCVRPFRVRCRRCCGRGRYRRDIVGRMRGGL